MKSKLLFIAITFFSTVALQAQVGVGNTNPQATLDITASSTLSPADNDGILIPRMSNFPSTPGATRDGMLIFYTGTGASGKGFYYWNNTTMTWIGINSGNKNTLDQAYDQGGAGAGRIIDAFDGAVQINGNNANDSGLLVNNYAINGQEAIGGTFTAYPGFPVGSSKIVGAKAEAITYTAEAIGLEATVTFNDPINANDDMQNYGVRSNVNILNPASSSIINYGIQASASNGNENWAAYFGDPSTPAAVNPIQYTGNVYVKDNLEIERGLIYRPNGAATSIGDILQYTTTTGQLEAVNPSTIFSDTANTLDQAYDQGGAGIGRTITADNGAVLINGTDGFQNTGDFGSGANLTLAGEGTRMFFYPRKAAFRAGYINGNQWDDTNIGEFSSAIGRNVTASGYSSHAYGNGNTASGNFSTALGINSNASGPFSMALGYNSNASTFGSIAIGIGCLSSGSNGSVAIGDNTTASAQQATAFGLSTLASGGRSTAFGRNTIASGINSTAFGYSTEARSYTETSLGLFNNLVTPVSLNAFDTSDLLFSIGNGIDDLNRSNALTIYKSGLININDSYNMPLNDGTANQVMTTDGSGNIGWVDPLTFAASTEWTDNGTYLSPIDGFNKDVSIGGGNANGKLNITSNNKNSGIQIINTQTGAIDAFGIINNMTATASTLSKIAIQNSIYTSASGEQYGVSNYLDNNSFSNKTGVINVLNGNSNADMYGVNNQISINGFGTHYGINNNVSGDGSGLRYAVYNRITGSGTGERYGMYNFIYGNTGNAKQYGVRNYIRNIGTGDKYGTLTEIETFAGGTHYGIWSEVLKPGSYSGYFLGNVYIGTSMSNGYILPASDGASNQIMTTDGTGTVTWQTPSNGDITGVTAGTGLTGGGVTGAITLNAVGTNGLTTNADDIRLGGTLTQATTIAQGNNEMVFNLNGTGDFRINDNGTSKLVVLDNGDTVLGGDFYMRDENTGGTLLARITDINGDDGALDLYNSDVLTTRINGGGDSYLNAGSLGIGTTTPNYPLSVSGTLNLREDLGTGTALRVNGTEALWFDGTYFSWGFGAAHNYFADAVGIGINAPAYKLDVRDANNGDYVAQIYNTSTNANADGLKIRVGNLAVPTGSTSYVAFFDGNNTVRGRIQGNGTGVTYNTISDRRLKTNINDIDNALQLIDNIQPRRYEFKSKLGIQEYGFIAQELQPLYPQAVTGTPDSDVETNPMMVDYSRLTPLLTAGIKELKDEVDTLKTENAILKAKLENLESLEARLTALENKSETKKENALANAND